MGNPERKKVRARVKRKAAAEARSERQRALLMDKRQALAEEKTKREIELLNTLVRKYGVDNITL